MSTVTEDQVERIRALNDSLRRDHIGGQIIFSRAVAELPEPERRKLLRFVREFQAFTADNDRYGEHDFGAVEHAGNRYFWKIDYYDNQLEFGSTDPADPAVTCRVLTIMLAEEY